MRNHFQIRKTFSDIVDVSVTLFKIMIPTLIIVKVLEEMGVVLILNQIMAPLTFLMGLPVEMAIVLTTTMLTNPYAGLIVFSNLPIGDEFTVAQATILASFMLLAHSLPVEVLIARKSGVRARMSLFVRVGGGLLLCVILNFLFQATGMLSGPALVTLPQLSATVGIQDWAIEQVKALLFVQIVIIVLLFLLEGLRVIGVERLIKLALSPFLRFMGVGDKAATIAVVGVTLGLGFGGGLLIKEVSSGNIPKEDVFGVLSFLNLSHSVFEDTAVVMLLGPSLFIVLVGRIIYAMLFVFILMKFAVSLSEEIWKQHLTNANIPEQAKLA